LETFCQEDFDHFVGHLHYLQEVYKVVFEDRAATTDLIEDHMVMCYPL